MSYVIWVVSHEKVLKLALFYIVDNFISRTTKIACKP